MILNVFLGVLSSINFTKHKELKQTKEVWGKHTFFCRGRRWNRFDEEVDPPQEEKPKYFHDLC